MWNVRDGLRHLRFVWPLVASAISKEHWSYLFGSSKVQSTHISVRVIVIGVQYSSFSYCECCIVFGSGAASAQVRPNRAHRTRSNQWRRAADERRTRISTAKFCDLRTGGSSRRPLLLCSNKVLCVWMKGLMRR